MKSKPTIQDLEALLNSEDDTPVHILPDGTIAGAQPEMPPAHTVSVEAYKLTVRIIERQQKTIKDAVAKLEDGNSLDALKILRAEVTPPPPP